MFKFPKGGVDEKSSDLVKSKAVEVYNKFNESSKNSLGEFVIVVVVVG